MISLIEFVSICGVATLTAAGASRGLNLLRRSRGGHSENPARPRDDEGTGRPSAGAWHEPRYGKRHLVSSRIEYSVGGRRYEGLLIDMSRQGWRARGAQPLVKGTAMTVQVYFSDVSQPITIDEAVVRWTEGLEFGVELIRMSPKSAAMLSDYLSAHFPTAQPAPVYALSPFSYN
jgi:PilZ domain-containing protein